MSLVIAKALQNLKKKAHSSFPLPQYLTPINHGKWKFENEEMKIKKTEIETQLT